MSADAMIAAVLRGDPVAILETVGYCCVCVQECNPANAIAHLDSRGGRTLYHPTCLAAKIECAPSFPWGRS